MASHMEWHLPVQEEADWLRLIKNKAVKYQDSYMKAFTVDFTYVEKSRAVYPDCVAIQYFIQIFIRNAFTLFGIFQQA